MEYKVGHRGPHILTDKDGNQDSCGGPCICEFCIKGRPASIHPLDCSRSHWGICDCDECGVKWHEQGDLPVVVPDRYEDIPRKN